MDFFSLLVYLLFYCIHVGAQLKLFPEKLTILRGEEARLTCSTSNTRWTVMIWLLNGAAVLTISKKNGVLPSINSNVTAEKSLVSTGDSWVLILKHTERYNQGQVTCDLQDIDRKTASLFVQEKGSVKVSGDKLAFMGQLALFECHAEGWYPQPTLQWWVNDKKVSQAEYNISSEESGRSLFTVNSNLSVTAAKSSYVDCLASVSALPTPLRSRIRLTVEPCQQEGIRFDQSGNKRGFVAEVTGGKDNLGFSSEGPTGAEHTKITMETHSNMNVNSLHKVPDVVSSSTLALHTDSQAQVCLSEESSTNVRRLTTV
nr:immunoglobulin superfamily member 5-like isoform X2 [Labrus bergylta]